MLGEPREAARFDVPHIYAVGDVDDFVDTVFNYPTLAECYKTAAFDGINRLGLS